MNKSDSLTCCLTSVIRQKEPCSNYIKLEFVPVKGLDDISVSDRHAKCESFMFIPTGSHYLHGYFCSWGVWSGRVSQFVSDMGGGNSFMFPVTIVFRFLTRIDITTPKKMWQEQNHSNQLIPNWKMFALWLRLASLIGRKLEGIIPK